MYTLVYIFFGYRVCQASGNTFSMQVRQRQIQRPLRGEDGCCRVSRENENPLNPFCILVSSLSFNEEADDARIEFEFSWFCISFWFSHNTQLNGWVIRCHPGVKRKSIVKHPLLVSSLSFRLMSKTNRVADTSKGRREKEREDTHVSFYVHVSRWSEGGWHERGEERERKVLWKKRQNEDSLGFNTFSFGDSWVVNESPSFK